MGGLISFLLKVFAMDNENIKLQLTLEWIKQGNTDTSYINELVNNLFKNITDDNS